MNIGRKIGRIRELRGMKQSTMAIELGIAQQNVSKLLSFLRSHGKNSNALRGKSSTPGTSRKK
ncbi:hypothetical protein SAMN05421820_101850 [Pedobacter steynii]|uniref:HTH cro/C1-type domain-containing protein n=1 Tax=Pedobacter steynii TaxID=430522 RepID=A0A1G9LEA1_9SPHI|nr:hypothetical protein SAMN05421820_101850 [Pedobacter steynii]